MSSPTLNPRTLFTLKNAADHLKEAQAEAPHSPNGLRNWADQGRIGCVKLSDGSRVIPGSELIRLMQGDSAR
jgi:hypothetical protein